MHAVRTPNKREGCFAHAFIFFFLMVGVGFMCSFAQQLQAPEDVQTSPVNASRVQLPPPTSLASSPAPIPTVIPTLIPTRRPTNFVVDMPYLIGANLDEVKAVLGTPSLVTNMSPGTIRAFTGPSVARTYHYRNFSFDAISDTAGRLRSIQIVYGLSDQGYHITDWPKAFARFGLPTELPTPDTKAPARYVWNSVDGMTVEVAQFGVSSTSKISSILVYLPPGRPWPTRIAPTPTRTRPAANPTATRALNQVAVLQDANRRSGPGTTFPIVGGAPAGSLVTVAATNADRDWIQLTDGSWIAAFLLEPIGVLPTIP